MDKLYTRLDILIESIGITNYALIALLQQNPHSKDDYKRIAFALQQLNDVTKQHNKLLDKERRDKT